MSNSLDALQVLIDDASLEDETIDTILKGIVDFSEDDDVIRLAAFIGWLRDNGNNATPDDIGAIGCNDKAFSYGRSEYLVLLDDEADDACADYIEDSLWAFNADFLAGETGIDADVFKALADKCEGANAAVLSLIKGSCGLDAFVKSATDVDGRGHFLASYDGEEHEFGAFYIYQIG